MADGYQGDNYNGGGIGGGEAAVRSMAAEPRGAGGFPKIFGEWRWGRLRSHRRVHHRTLATAEPDNAHEAVPIRNERQALSDATRFVELPWAGDQGPRRSAFCRPKTALGGSCEFISKAGPRHRPGRWDACCGGTGNDPDQFPPCVSWSPSRPSTFEKGLTLWLPFADPRLSRELLTASLSPLYMGNMKAYIEGQLEAIAELQSAAYPSPHDHTRGAG